MVQLALLLVGVLMFPTDVLASGIERGYGMWLRNNTEVVYDNIKNMLKPHITSKERRIVRSVKMRVSSSPNVNAYAYRTGSRRVVRIDTGYLFSIDQLSLAFIVDNELGYTGCYEEFLRSILKGIDENSISVSDKRQPVHGVEGVWLRARNHQSACYGANTRELDADNDAGDLYAGTVEGALSFMLLHELAHHILGHVDVPKSEMNMSISRRNETSADVWAFQKGLDIQINPIAGSASWIFFSALDGADLTQEISSTHPVALRRFKRMLKFVLKYGDTKEYDETFGEPFDEDIADDIRATLNKLDDMLPD